MKSNGKLVELIEKVKPEIRTLIEKCNTVRAQNNSQKFLERSIRNGRFNPRGCILFFHAVFCSSAGQNVGSAADP